MMHGQTNIKFNAPIPHERGTRMHQVVPVGPDF